MNKKKISISEKMQELEERTNWFYSDDFSLEQAAEAYQKTLALANEIEKDLSDLKNEISVIEKNFAIEEE